MADILLDGLPVLDLLEIAPSTSVVAQIIQRDQSSISRIYRQVSGRLGLEFRKHANGLYGAGSNQGLLQGLRLSSQWLRLQSAPPEPRWLACGSLSLDGNGEHPCLPAGLLQRCPQLRGILHNGGESFRHAKALKKALQDAACGERVLIHRLPSTSPANASWTFEQKLSAWQAVMNTHGMLA